MRAPHTRRPEIVAEAVELIGGSDEARLAVVASIEMLRGVHREMADLPSPGDMRDSIRDYVKLLVAAQRTDAARAFERAGLFDDKIRHFSFVADHFKVPAGAKPRNETAAGTAIVARSILQDLKLPAPLTERGLWHRLTTLLYEAVTGVPSKTSEAMLWKYCLEADQPRPKYVLQRVRIHPDVLKKLRIKTGD
jgi:hypothetical protein